MCPICGDSTTVPVHRAVRDFEHGLPVSVDFDACASCGLVFQTPAPSAADLSTYYPSDYRPHVAANGASLIGRLKAVQASLQLQKVARFLPDRTAPILELGSGAGHFLRALEKRGHTQLFAIDRSPDLSRVFEGTSIRYRALDLDRSLDLGGPYAAIVMNYVIEHFVSPESVLRASKRALLPGGRVLLLTPNSGSWSHRVFGRYWSGLHAPRHTQVFNPENLTRLAEKIGFGNVEVIQSADPASWTLSFQNLVQDETPHAGTAWYSLALLPAWYPVAFAERALHRASSMYAVLTA